MSLTENGNSGNGLVMPVAPMYAGGGYGGNGFNGDASWWIIILFLFAFCGFGNGYGNGGGGNSVPYIMNSTTNSDVQRGFDQQSVMSGIAGIQSGVSGLSTQLCNATGDIQQSLCGGFAGVNATINNGFSNAETAATARQMANMNQAFNAQTAMMQGFNNIGTQFADCCCENRLANCQTQNIIQNEGNATRFADANNTRDIIQSQTNGTQAILDKLCQLELDGVKAQVEAKNDKIIDLQNQLNRAAFRESQVEQNAFIQAGLTNEVDALYNRLSNCPVPTTPVYGRTPIFTCNNNGNSCGCGCG